MSPTLARLLPVALAVISLALPACAESPVLEVPYTRIAPELDGEIDDAWAQAVEQKVDKVVFGYRKNEADVSATFRLLYDNDNLYALFVVNDSERQNDSWDAFDDDAVEIYLDGGNDKSSYFYDANDCQYTFGVGDKEVWTTEGTGDHAGVAFKSVETDSGYRVEIKLPWKDAKVAVAPGAKVGLDVHVDDDDDGWEMDCALGWATSMPDSWTDPSLFATMILGPTTAEPGAPVDPATPAEPAEAATEPTPTEPTPTEPTPTEPTPAEAAPTESGAKPTEDEPKPEVGDGETLIARAKATPEIDGDVDEAWADATSHAVSKVVFGYRKNEGDISGSFQTLYDAENLYLLFTVTDSERQNDSWESFDDDAVDVYIDGGHERTTYYYDANDCQYTFGVGDKDVWATEGTGDHAGVAFASKETDEGYRVEIKIPWSDVSVKEAKPGVKIGLDVHLDDDDDGWEMDCALGWSTSVPDSWTDPSLFATMVLGK